MKTPTEWDDLLSVDCGDHHSLDTIRLIQADALEHAAAMCDRRCHAQTCAQDIRDEIAELEAEK